MRKDIKPEEIQKSQKPRRKSTIRKTVFKITFGLVLASTVAQPAAKPVEAKTYSVKSGYEDRAAKKASKQIIKVLKSGKDKNLTLRFTVKPYYSHSAKYRAGNLGDSLDRFVNSDYSYELKDGKKLQFDIEKVKVGAKNKKLGKYVKVTLKKKGKNVVLTYKVKVPGSQVKKDKAAVSTSAASAQETTPEAARTLFDEICEQEQTKSAKEYRKKAAEEIKGFIVEDTIEGKIAAFFTFCRQKRDLGSDDGKTWSEKFYKAPLKEISAYNADYEKPGMTEEEIKNFKVGMEIWTKEILNEIGVDAYYADDRHLTNQCAIKYKGLQLFVNTSVASMTETNTGFWGACLRPYVYDGHVYFSHNYSDSVNNSVEVFLRNKDKKFEQDSDDIKKQYPDLFDEDGYLHESLFAWDIELEKKVWNASDELLKRYKLPV